LALALDVATVKATVVANTAVKQAALVTVTRFVILIAPMLKPQLRCDCERGAQAFSQAP
jgi:hypothetical protein